MSSVFAYFLHFAKNVKKPIRRQKHSQIAMPISLDFIGHGGHEKIVEKNLFAVKNSGQEIRNTA